MKVSVIIPTLNSVQTISGTLEAVLSGTRLPDEILIVDGGSTDDTRTVVRHFGVQIIPNPKRHVAAARQLGSEFAQGEILVFTDSDCLPDTNWLARITSHFCADPDLCGVGGKVVLSQPRNQVQAFSASVFETIMQFPTHMSYITERGMSGTFPGANCAYRRDTVLDIGGFRDFYSNHAEEVDLFWRLLQRKSKLLFDPAIIVEHLEYADTVPKLILANFNYGIASTKLAKHHIGPQIDFKLYRLLAGNLVCLFNPSCHSYRTRLSSLQLAAFICGKVYSSIVFRSINL